MSTSVEPPRSRGMMMIAAYRADRLNQRPLLRKGLQQAHTTLRQACSGGDLEPASHQAGASAMPGADPGHFAQRASGAVAPGCAASDPEIRSKVLERGSVFADLVNVTIVERHAETTASIPDPVPAIDPSPTPGPPAPQPAAPSETQAVATEPVTTEAPTIAVAAQQHDGPSSPASSQMGAVPLAEIGFGPGMLIRLSQLGFHSIDDLAGANSTELRIALGDISRLVDVERWISSARRLSHGEEGFVSEAETAYPANSCRIKPLSGAQ